MSTSSVELVPNLQFTFPLIRIELSNSVADPQPSLNHDFPRVNFNGMMGSLVSFSGGAITIKWSPPKVLRGRVNKEESIKSVHLKVKFIWAILFYGDNFIGMS